MKRKNSTSTKPNNSFVIYLNSAETRVAATAAEALRLALTALGQSKKTSHLSEEEAVKCIYSLAKQDCIHRFTLPWNLYFDWRNQKLIVKDYQGQDKSKGKEKSGGLSKDSALALLPSVVKNHTEKIDKLEDLSSKLTALLEQQVETNKLTKSRIDSLESRCDSIESRLAKLEASASKASKPSKKAEVKVEAIASGKKTEADAIKEILKNFNLA